MRNGLRYGRRILCGRDRDKTRRALQFTLFAIRYNVVIIASIRTVSITIASAETKRSGFAFKFMLHWERRAVSCDVRSALTWISIYRIRVLIESGQCV